MKIQCLKIFQENHAKGFWDERLEILQNGTSFMKKAVLSQCLFLIAGELCESLDSGKDVKIDDVERIKSLPDEQFPSAFIDAIKDTFEDEIADTAIRIADLLGWCNVGFVNAITTVSPIIDDASFQSDDYVLVMIRKVNDLHEFIRKASDEDLMPELATRLIMLLNGCLHISEIYGFSLADHIEAKLRYNRTRAYKHGKIF